jgi:predicted porin
VGRASWTLGLGLALVAAVGGAQAQSSVSLYGLADLSVGRTQAPGGVATKGVESGKMTTSYFGVKGSEDLGGGMSAQFAIESFMRNDTGEAGRFNGDTFWARNAYVGLAGSAGTVTLGRNTTSLFVSVLVFNALGDSFGYSPAIRHYFTSGTVSGDTGWSDSIKYTSPRLGGATFTAHVAAGEGNGGRNAGLSGMYFSGPLGATLAWQKVEKGAAVADTTSWNLGASYDFGPAKLFGQYGNAGNRSTGIDHKILGLGASVGLGATGKLLAQWGRVSPDTGAKLRTMTVGYDYFLSKRTDAYVMAMSDSRTGLSSGKSFGLGMRHRF